MSRKSNIYPNSKGLKLVDNGDTSQCTNNDHGYNLERGSTCRQVLPCGFRSLTITDPSCHKHQTGLMRQKIPYREFLQAKS